MKNSRISALASWALSFTSPYALTLSMPILQRRDSSGPRLGKTHKIRYNRHSQRQFTKIKQSVSEAWDARGYGQVGPKSRQVERAEERAFAKANK